MDQNNSNNPFDSFIDNNVDMDGIDGIHCHIIHPKIDRELAKLTSDEAGWQDCWEGQLTSSQNQLRHCLTTEVEEQLIMGSANEVAGPAGLNLYIYNPIEIHTLIMAAITWGMILDQRINQEAE